MDKPPACCILCVFYLCLNFFWSQIRICPDMKIFDLTLLLKSPTISFFRSQQILKFCWMLTLSNFDSEGVDVMWDVSTSPQSIPNPRLQPQSCPQVDWSELVKHCSTVVFQRMLKAAATRLILTINRFSCPKSLEITYRKTVYAERHDFR